MAGERGLRLLADWYHACNRDPRLNICLPYEYLFGAIYLLVYCLPTCPKQTPAVMTTDDLLMTTHPAPS